MHSIMPPGYERENLQNALRKARAVELAAADKEQRKRIEKEIRAEVERRLGKDSPWHRGHGSVLW